jgi:hypothetical protein
MITKAIGKEALSEIPIAKCTTPHSARPRFCKWAIVWYWRQRAFFIRNLSPKSQTAAAHPAASYVELNTGKF